MLDHQVERLLANLLGEVGVDRDVAVEQRLDDRPMLPITLRERTVSPRITPRWRARR
jgi:hypothetical protein